MIKIITVLILSIFSLYSNAANTTSVEFSDDLKFDNCKKPDNAPIVYCVAGKKKAVIHINSKGVLQGVVDDGSNVARTFSVRQITEGGEVKYFNALSEKLNEEQRLSEFDTPLSRETKLLESSVAINAMIKSSNSLDDDVVKTLKDMHRKVTKSIDINQSAAHSGLLNIWVIDSEGENAACKKSTYNCPIKKCGKGHYLIYDVKKGIYLPINYTRDSHGKAKFTKNDKYITTVRTLGGPVLEKNSAYEKSRLNDHRKVPEEMKNNSTAYFHFQDSRFADYIRSVVPNCSHSTKVDVLALANSALKFRENLDLVHVVDIINGKVNSQYINKKFLPKDSCKQGDSYYVGHAYKRTRDYRPRSSGIISLKKAKQLAKKAKAMKGMAWGYVRDGCYARAELMINMFEEEGIVADKAWTSGNLRVPNGDGLTWSYHVAPVVYVKDKSGHVKKMIIDPVIDDEPIEVNQWLAKMAVNPKNIDVVGFPPSLEAGVVGRSAFGISDRASYNPTVDTVLTKEVRMASAQKTLMEFEKRLKQ